MLTLFLAAQLAVAAIPDTATYSSTALRTLVNEAVLVNNRVPASLGRYRARVESEIAIGQRDGAGHESEESIEQVASELQWSRTGDFEQHVTGYRSQSRGFQFATIGFFRNAWVVPSLYGNRLSLLFGVDTTRRRAGAGISKLSGSRGDANPRTTLVAIHPLSVDRENLYRFSGGDTVEKLNVGDREIRIVRILVEPKAKLPYRTVVFSGEMDLDVDRKHVVRMRGSFASTSEGPGGGLSGLLGSVRPTGIAFVELVNSEVSQEFWLPSYQRFEAQAMLPVMGDAKAVFRIVSRFSDYVITPPDAAAVAAGVPLDTLRPRPHVLSMATRDSLAAFRAWRDEIGTATLNVYGGSTTARLGTRESSKVGRTPLYQIEVPVSTIDAQLEAFPAPALVKMDIEGAEAPALRGATALLTQVKPTLICELHGTNAPVMDVLDSCGYRVTTVGTPEIAPRDANWWGAHILATPT